MADYSTVTKVPIKPIDVANDSLPYPPYPPPPYTPTLEPIIQQLHSNVQLPSSVVVSQPQMPTQTPAQTLTQTSTQTPVQMLAQTPAPPPSLPNNGWMQVPAGPFNCAPGFECLSLIDEVILFKPKSRLPYSNSKFSIKNTTGQNIYWAEEDTNVCTRNCLGHRRAFHMKIFDAYRNETINFYRPYAPASCCFPCCLHVLEVTLPNGQMIGSVKQEYSIYTHFSVKDHNDDIILRIEGAGRNFNMSQVFFDYANFRIVALDGTQVGSITRPGGHFDIKFPPNSDYRLKSVLIGACALINSMQFF